MFDAATAEPAGSGRGAEHAGALAAAVTAHADRLGAAAVAELEAGESGADLVDLLTGLSRLVAAAEACAARAAVGLDRLRRAGEAAAGVRAEQRGAGVAAEVALARRCAAAQGRSWLGFGKVLCTEMPHTMARLAAGDLTPWRAMLLAKESACLELEDRKRLDEDLCADPVRLAGLGDRAVGDAARAWCIREDPASVVARRSQAEADRRVWLRPAPDAMAVLSALVPVAEGVAAYGALLKRADQARAAGDERTRGQVMADAVVAGVTGRPEGESPGVLVNLVMTDTALFRGDTEPGHVPGFGPVPAATARELVERAGSGAGAFVRRLYRAPGSGALVGMDASTRRVPQGLGELVRLRDGGRCRMPWCDAPIRHIDHAVGVVDGGRTSASNLEGLCESHNYSKQVLGWRATASAPGMGRHRVVIVTPTGHQYSGTAPPLPGWRHDAGSPGERHLRDALPLVA